MPEYYVYILTNKINSVIYTGVTGNLYERVLQHKTGAGGKFTSQYRTTKLVYFEVYQYVYDAIDREKQIKAGSRQDKMNLIVEMNPDWKDLFSELTF